MSNPNSSVNATKSPPNKARTNKKPTIEWAIRALSLADPVHDVKEQDGVKSVTSGASRNEVAFMQLRTRLPVKRGGGGLCSGMWLVRVPVKCLGLARCGVVKRNSHGVTEDAGGDGANRVKPALPGVSVVYE